jgi:hypothetical protein
VILGGFLTTESIVETQCIASVQFFGGFFNAKDANVTRKGREKMRGVRKILGYFVFFSRFFRVYFVCFAFKFPVFRV